MSDIPSWITWGSVAGFIGLLTGLITFLWKLNDKIKNWRNKPKIEILKHDIWNGRWVALSGNRYAKFYCLHIRNNGKISAKRCVAKLKIINKPDNATNIDLNEEHKLHWADLFIF